MSAVLVGARDFASAAARRRRRPPFVIGLCFLLMGGVAVIAVFGALLTPQDPNAQNVLLILAKPSGAHWLGTDSLGQFE